MRVPIIALALFTVPSLSFAQQWPPPPPPDGQQPPPPPPDPSPDGSRGGMQPGRAAFNMVYGPEPDSSGSRLTLAVTQGFAGAGLGLSLATLSGSQSPGVYAGSMLLGSGAGLVASLVATRDGVTEGQVAAVNTGTLYGALGSLFLTLGVSRAGLQSQAVGGIFAAGLTLGTAGGVVLALQNPRSGRVEFASSIGLWSAFTTSHIFLAARVYNSDSALQVFGFSSLGALGAGLTLGAVLSQRVDVSAARMRYINLAGLGGYAIIGLSSMLFALESGGETVVTAYSIGSILGAGGGLLLGTLLTNRTDDYWHSQHRSARREARPSANLMPGGPYGTLGATLAGSF